MSEDEIQQAHSEIEEMKKKLEQKQKAIQKLKKGREIEKIRERELEQKKKQVKVDEYTKRLEYYKSLSSPDNNEYRYEAFYRKYECSESPIPGSLLMIIDALHEQYMGEINSLKEEIKKLKNRS